MTVQRLKNEGLNMANRDKINSTMHVKKPFVSRISDAIYKHNKRAKRVLFKERAIKHLSKGVINADEFLE